MSLLLRCALLVLVLLTQVAAGQAAVTTAMPTTPGHHKLHFSQKVGATVVDIPCLVYLPVGYDKSTDTWPMLCFLHGAGEGGNDLGGVFVHGPAPLLENNAKIKAAYPFIGIYPQCNGRRWDDAVQMQATMQVLDELQAKLRIDKDRCYCTGLSMGGKGTWVAALASPERWAAIAPISAVEVEPAVAAEKLKDVAVWIIAGAQDGGFTEGSKKMYEALAGNGCNAQLSVIPNEGHGVWGRYYPDPSFYLWFLQYRRPSAKERADRAALRDLIPPAAGVVAKAAKPLGPITAVSIDAAKLRKGGLRGSYFTGTNLDKLAFERFDAKIDIADRSFPFPDKRQEDLSVRWAGFISIDAPGVYTFSTAADDGQRLWIGDVPLIDDWNAHGVMEVSGQVELGKGFYPIRIEYFQGGGGGQVTASWSGPNKPKQVLSGDVLFATPWAGMK